MMKNRRKFGYFCDSTTGEIVDFQRLKLEHLEGRSIHPWLWWVKKPQYKLLEDLIYVDPLGIVWKIRKGFVFDGGTIPWIFWWLCPPDHPNALPGFCIHDKICLEPHPCSSRYGAFVLWAAARANGMYAWGALRNWFFVRFFGPQFNASGDNNV